MTTSDVLRFIEAQRQPRHGNVVRLVDGEAGMAASTIKRRLATVSSLFDYLSARGLVARNPVPRSLSARPGRAPLRGSPLVRAPRRLPRILGPDEVDRLVGGAADRPGPGDGVADAARRAAALRGPRPADGRPAAGRAAGVHRRRQGRPPAASCRSGAVFFTALAAYFDRERRPATGVDHVFVVLKGPNRGRPLSAAGVDEVLTGARARAGLAHATCHELRHTCFTRLREAGMALEAIQAQAGHASIESTRIYLHLAADWLVDEYRKAMDILDGLAGSPS